ncbi:glycosyltransferase family 2 protein [Microbacterium sp. P07]|uniref:glycosyltransferase family 2 protein n=1 Tax=Microbacterium sp. P07 TaxID=3366952 RepID=UPI003746759E
MRARFAAVLCVALWLLYMTTVVITLSRGGALTDAWHLIGTVLFLVSVTMLTFSACMYLLARAGALPRFANHRRDRRADIDGFFAENPTRVLALIPSYDEDPALVRLGLWSVALQEIPHLRVVLLLDDPPTPLDPATRERLDRTRQLAAEIAEALAPIRDLARHALGELTDATDDAVAAARVAEVHDRATAWLRRMAEAEPTTTHIEQFFVDQVLRALADDLAASAAALREAQHDPDFALDRARVTQLLQRVVWIFSAETDVFERKRFSSLSHEATKAMNLNAYLGLLGGRHRLRIAGATDSTRSAEERYEIVDVPECDFVLTLDADSMLLPEYALRLVYRMHAPGAERVAVMQTPYSAYRGAQSRLERLAGATTDLQHIVHQGLTAFSATFWVGANAIIRRTSLEDLRTTTVEDGIEVTRFIQGVTVIEDTESSIDIVSHGWTLVNYPERLSYSTSPADFGTLVIQRRRWANGGLLILARLHALVRQRQASGHPVSFAERMLRANYLGSIAWVTVGLLVLMTVFPLDGELVSVVLLLIALPYFVEMAHDLRYLGYRRSDVIGIYGLNLLLVAVNLAGTIGSISQALSGSKSAFARTPKVPTHTPAGALYILTPLAIGVGAAVIGVRAASEGAWVATAFAAFTSLCVLGAMVRLIGVRFAVSDAWNGWLEWIWVDAAEPTRPVSIAPALPAWRSVLDDALEPAAVAR